MDEQLDALVRARDFCAVRRHGVRRGFRNKRWRRRLWAAVCGLVGDESSVARNAPDSQVSLDVLRAMHFDCCHEWDAARRERTLADLTTVLSAAFPRIMSGGTPDVDSPHYYQGAHDVASVLLLEVGPRDAARIMHAIVRSQLQGFVRPTLEPAVATLRLLLPLVAAADPAVHSALSRHLASAGMDNDVPHFALPWLLTWFSHVCVSLEALGRLFDAFLSGHPLLPLYASAALLVECRDRVLALEPDYGPAHMALTELPLLLSSGRVLDAVIVRAEALFRARPPQALLSAAPQDVQEVMRAQWPAAARAAHNAWGGALPWPSSTLLLVVGGSIAAAAAAIVWAMWRR